MLSILQRIFPPRYHVIEDACSDQEKNSMITTDRTQQKVQRLPVSNQLPWIISTVFFASLSTLLLVNGRGHNSLGAFERGFTTDLGTYVRMVTLVPSW